MRLGKIPENIYKRSIWKELDCKSEKMTDGAVVGENCAILTSSGEETGITCTVSVTGQFADAGRRAVYTVANRLAALGTEPAAVMISAFLPKTQPEDELKQLMRRIRAACRELGIKSFPGHFTVIDHTEYPMLAMTGIGKAGKNTLHFASSARPGQDVVVSKWIGLEGTFLLAKEKKAELTEHFSAEYIEEALVFDQYYSILPEAAAAVKSGAGAMYSMTEGGIFGALWELAESSGVGLEVDLKKIPIRQETVEICNYYDMNPYEMFSLGSLLMTAENGYDLVQNLKKKGLNASVIGKTTGSNDRLILNEDEKRFLTPAGMDELYKIIV